MGKDGKIQVNQNPNSGTSQLCPASHRGYRSTKALAVPTAWVASNTATATATAGSGCTAGRTAAACTASRTARRATRASSAATSARGWEWRAGWMAHVTW